MKDTLLLVINNMACRYRREDFIKTSFEPFLKCTESDYFNTKLVIIDDSGDKISDLDFYNYYKDFDRYSKVKVLSNKVNQNLLRSRFRVFDIIEDSELDHTWIRFLDSGDTTINNQKFQMELMMKSNDKPKADWFIFPQGIKSIYDSKKNFLDSFYYTCFGDTSDKSRIIESTLSGFNACGMWNKVFKASNLKRVMNSIKLHNNGEIPYLFHTEDYLINCLYAYYTTEIATLNTVYILYDNVSGDSSSKEVTQEVYDSINNQIETVRKTILDFYMNYDKMSLNVKKYYVSKKLDKWMLRFKVK